MARSSLLEAVVDEVDQALQALQTARRFLREMERESPAAARPPARLPREGESSLRFSGMTVAEAARVLDMSEDHIRRLLRAGELEGAPYSGKIGWRLDPHYVMMIAEQRLAAREGQRRAREQSNTPKKSAQRNKRKT